MPVEGIGGIFFRAKDPDALASWYKDVLGVGGGCGGEEGAAADEWTWTTKGGPVVFAPFAAASDYFPMEKAFMLNLRVRDMDSVLGKLRGAGIAVITNPEWDGAGMGRFARIHDPEGNAIELWEPAA